MTRKPSRSNVVKKPLFTAHYQGRDIIEVLNYSIVHGNTYAEIRFQDGRIHTVPANEIYMEQKEKEYVEYE